MTIHFSVDSFNCGWFTHRMRTIRRPLSLLLLALMTWIPIQAQRIAHDPKVWIPQHTPGAPIQVRMNSPAGKVYKGTIVSTGPDSFMLQPGHRFLSPRPQPMILSYANIQFAEEFQPDDNHHVGLFIVIGVAAAPG